MKTAPNPVSASAANFTTFCLGTGMEKCRTCQHDKNWQTLNEFEDALRKPMQSRMHRVNNSHCQITSGRLYAPMATPGAPA
ncbi:hypothetical protein NF681_11385 [Comamonadaceae bacterium OTU4NAUVB1]|nr:hypothetical protein NF681_11385 [Comamonadaceae bacterium OTU4NAUVB1]